MPTNCADHDECVKKMDQIVQTIKDHKDDFQKLQGNFTNVVGIVAFVFRTRGHHYMKDFNDVYIKLWGKLRTSCTILDNNWEGVATIALHAVYPMILDEYWKLAVDTCTVDNSLRLRFNAPSAGTAAVRAIDVGLNDVGAIFKQIYKGTKSGS